MALEELVELKAEAINSKITFWINISTIYVTGFFISLSMQFATLVCFQHCNHLKHLFSLSKLGVKLPYLFLSLIYRAYRQLAFFFGKN